MSTNIQKAAGMLRYELGLPYEGIRSVSIADNLIARLNPNKTFRVQVQKQVHGKRFYESVNGGTPRNIDEIVAAAFEARKRALRKAEAYRAKASAAVVAHVKDKPDPTYIIVGDYDNPKPQPANHDVGTLKSEELAKLLNMAMMLATGLVLGYIIWGAL